MATMLYALELPPIGGDTLFANQVQAYESLSDGLKDTLASLKAHSCHFEGWSIAESEGLLNLHYAHQIREEFQCRHIWQKGDVAIWDNRCTSLSCQ